MHRHHVAGMHVDLFVQVYECTQGHRRPTARVPVGEFMVQAFERLSPLDLLQLRNDLTILGHSRGDAVNGRWHEYVLTSGYVG